LVAGLLRPRPFLKQVEHSSKSCERHTRSYCVSSELGVGKLEGSERVAGSWYRQGGNIHGWGSS
jgi:hypothetical protein